ncbi:MAG: alpha/beta hydrolase [Alphaproteobacteria bacterium]
MLNDVSIDPKDGKKPEYVVIFFHGLGSSGASMQSWAGGLLSPHLPNAKLVFPDGPLEFGQDGEGNKYYTWFPIKDLLDGDKAPDKAEIGRRATLAAKDMNAYIDEVLKREGISEDKLIIAGFSMGGTMAVYTALQRNTPVAGVYALSGGALELENIGPVKSMPPIGLVAGALEQQDYSGAPHAEKVHQAFDKAGFFADCVIVPEQKHEVSPKSMELLAVFTKAVTGEPFKAKQAASRKPPTP